MDEIKIGDKVRSFDFPDRFETAAEQPLTGPRACFVEGIVEGFTERGGCNRYVVKATKRVFGGVELDPVEWEDTHFIPVVNGTPTLFGGVTSFVVKIG
jgi:hypothetical protein